MDPSELGYSRWAYWILGLYIVHGVVVMLLVRFRKESTPSFRLLVHAADIVWPVLVTLFATGQGGPFFLVFVFVLGASAYRWGLRETFGTAIATVALLWMWLLDANLGFVNHLLGMVGIDSLGYLNSPTWAMPSIALINTWAYTGYTALLLYAGMLQIPQYLYESAAIDGATELGMFRRITLPLLRPILALVLVVSLIGSFQISMPHSLAGT